MSQIEARETKFNTNSVIHMNTNRIFRDKCILNIRGIEFTVKQDLLIKYPTTRLGKLVNLKSTQEILNLCDDYDIDRNEYYFNRDPFLFNTILNYFTTNKLHIGQNDCVCQIRDELEYWQIDEGLIELCCRRLFDEQIHSIDLFKKHIKELVCELNCVNDFSKQCFSGLKEKCWNLFENPNSSKHAKVEIAINLKNIKELNFL